jgi:hypothetical protein
VDTIPPGFSMLRAGFYVDGFNFYCAVVDNGDNSLKWMSYMRLAKKLAKCAKLGESGRIGSRVCRG